MLSENSCEIVETIPFSLGCAMECGKKKKCCKKYKKKGKMQCRKCPKMFA